MAGEIEQEETRGVGRPLLFESAEALQERIDAYFAHCDPHPEEVIVYEWQTKTIKDKKGKEIEVPNRAIPPVEAKEWRMSLPIPYTVTGLALFLNTSRETLVNYEEKSEQYFDTIKKAKDRIEESLEMRLGGNNVTGIIFNLKNNWKWKDRTEQDITSKDKQIKGIGINIKDFSRTEDATS